MLSLPSNARIFYSPVPVGLGHSYDGLAGAVRSALGRDPCEAGSLFVFFNRRRTMVKVLQWEGDGRPFCLGRKNWLFVGGSDGGRRMAILASFAATCKENGVDFEKWLLDVLVRIDHTTPKQLPALLPHLWKTAATQA